MTQTISRFLALLVLLAFIHVLPAAAAEEQIYTIKKGDTLWGISQRFIDDPYYWPNVWANNPEISNPHLIFPGQKIRILDGRLEIIPAYQDAEKPAISEQEQPEEQNEEPVIVKASAGGNDFILTDEQPLGILVDSVDNRVLLTENDMVFVKMKNPEDVAVGDTYSLYSRGETIKHPHTGQVLGTMMYDLGYLQVTELKGQTVVARLVKNYREVTRGAELFEYSPPTTELVLNAPLTDLRGYIVASRSGQIAQSAGNVIQTDLGKNDNLLPGNMLYISRPRKMTDAMLKKAGALELPDAVLGAAIVLETKDQTSSALIIKSVDSIFVGDKVSLVEE